MRVPDPTEETEKEEEPGLSRKPSEECSRPSVFLGKGFEEDRGALLGNGLGRQKTHFLSFKMGALRGLVRERWVDFSCLGQSLICA